MNALAPSQRWWMVALRGILALAFGFIVFLAPGITLRALLLVFGAFALVDGVVAVVIALTLPILRGRVGLLLVTGLFSIVIGIVAFIAPGITALILLYLIAVRAIIEGIAEIAGAISMRNILEHDWLVGVSGAISIIFGIVLAVFPRTGVLAVLFVIGFYALFTGAALLARSWTLAGLSRKQEAGVPRMARR